MKQITRRILLLFFATAVLIPLGGCAEGPLWRLGAFTPWARREWEKDEKIATSMFTRRDRIRDLAEDAEDMSPRQQEQACQELAASLQPQNPIILRIEAVRALGHFSVPAASQLLGTASIDNDPQVRNIACTAWANHGGPKALQALQDALRSDTDIDVRLAATRALGKLGRRESLESLSLALNDRDPAIQLRAMESLESITGEDHGYDVAAWRRYLRGVNPESASPALISEGPNYDEPSIIERIRGRF